MASRASIAKKFRRFLAEINEIVEAKPHLTMVVTFVLCALIMVLRKPEAFTQAQFWAEDGIVWFGQAYNQGFWQTIFLPYSGTFSLATRLIGYLTTRAPLAAAPLLFNVAAGLMQLLPVFIINSSRFKQIVRYQLVAIALSLVYVCLPNTAEVFVNLANIQWHLGIAAFLVLIAIPSTKRSWLIFDAVVLGLTGLTGPLTLILVVLAFIIWLRNKKHLSARLHVIVLAITSVFQLVSLLVIEPGQRGGHMVMSVANGIKMWAGQIYTGGILGTSNADLFYDSLWLYVALALGLFVTVYAIKKGPAWLGYANLYALLIFGFMLASLKPLKGVDVWGILTHEATGQRYWYIPIFVWVMTIVWVALAAKQWMLSSVCGCLLVLLVAIGIPNSWRIAPLPDRHYQQSVDKFNRLPSGKHMLIPINPDGWYVNLEKH